MVIGGVADEEKIDVGVPLNITTVLRCQKIRHSLERRALVRNVLGLHNEKRTGRDDANEGVRLAPSADAWNDPFPLLRAAVG